MWIYLQSLVRFFTSQEIHNNHLYPLIEHPLGHRAPYGGGVCVGWGGLWGGTNNCCGFPALYINAACYSQNLQWKLSLTVTLCYTISQIQIRVRDQSAPEQTADVRVLVTIKRDQRDPVFVNAPYKAELDENMLVGAVIETKPSAIQARDDDLVGRVTWVDVYNAFISRYQISCITLQIQNYQNYVSVFRGHISFCRCMFWRTLCLHGRHCLHQVPANETGCTLLVWNQLLNIFTCINRNIQIKSPVHNNQNIPPNIVNINVN